MVRAKEKLQYGALMEFVDSDRFAIENKLTVAGAKFERDFMKQVPIGRVGEAIEMARPVVFMASDLASYMTGQSIIVDGGWTKGLA